MAQILVFGDSIAYGAFDSEAGGWVDRLKAFFFKDGQNCDYFVYNLGISGDTTEDLLERFVFETKQRKKEADSTEAIVIIEIGANDSALIRSKNDAWVAPEKFEGNLKKLVALAKKVSSKIIFVGLAPVDESKTMPVSWNANVTYKHEFIKRYNDILKSICEKSKIYFVDLFDELLKMNYKKMLEDGTHPNTEGHKKMFEIIKEFLVKNKIV